MWTILLLCLSNVFMTFAWYGHLKFFPNHAQPMWVIILFSWGIALVEYCFAVPANRIGTETYGFQTAQLKIMQEIITLLVFAVFSVLFLKEKLGWNHAAGFLCMVAAAVFIFNPFAKLSNAAHASSSLTTDAQTTQPVQVKP